MSNKVKGISLLVFCLIIVILVIYGLTWAGMAVPSFWGVLRIWGIIIGAALVAAIACASFFGGIELLTKKDN